jgi:hypothetical protein
MRHIAMNIKFEGQTHQIDANTLISSLVHYQTVINEANRIYGNGTRNITLKVNAINKGSFVVDVSIEEGLKGLFSNDTINYIAGLVTIIGGVYGAYSHLKGKPAKNKEDINSISIKTGKNSNIEINQNIVNVYNQPVVREAISKTIQMADEDPCVDGVSIDNGEGFKTEFKKEDFKELIYNDFDKEEDIPNEKIEEVEALLTIIALNFESGSKWQFIYNGFKIPMIVKDDALMKKIDEGERFGKGDAIKVRMRILKRYNNQYKTYENKSYKIVEFYEHIIAPKQSDIF